MRRAAQRRLATFNLHLVPVLPPGLQHRFGSELLDANPDDRRGLRAAATVPPEARWLAHVGRPRLRRRHRESSNVCQTTALPSDADLCFQVDIKLWHNADGMGRSWTEISVSGAHNREWTGDPAYRYTARVNGTGTSDIFAETNSCKTATLSRSDRLADMEGYHRYQPVAAGERVCAAALLAHVARPRLCRWQTGCGLRRLGRLHRLLDDCVSGVTRA